MEKKSRGGRNERKGRQDGEGSRKRRGSNGEEWEKWAKLMDGGYYIEGIMRGRDSLMREVIEAAWQS